MSFPEEMPVARGAWATYIKSRRPNFKAHTNSAHAKNALRQHWRSYHNALDEIHRREGGYFTEAMGVYELAQKNDGVVWKLKTVVTEGSRDLDYPELWPSAK